MSRYPVDVSHLDTISNSALALICINCQVKTNFHKVMSAERREKASYASENVLLFYFIFYSVVTMNSQVKKKKLKRPGHLRHFSLVGFSGKML